MDYWFLFLYIIPCIVCLGTGLVWMYEDSDDLTVLEMLLVIILALFPILNFYIFSVLIVYWVELFLKWKPFAK